jgi:hypothetical protein
MSGLARSPVAGSLSNSFSPRSPARCGIPRLWNKMSHANPQKIANSQIWATSPDFHG